LKKKKKDSFSPFSHPEAQGVFAHFRDRTAEDLKDDDIFHQHAGRVMKVIEKVKRTGRSSSIPIFLVTHFKKLLSNRMETFASKV